MPVKRPRTRRLIRIRPEYGVDSKLVHFVNQHDEIAQNFVGHGNIRLAAN